MAVGVASPLANSLYPSGGGAASIPVVEAVPMGQPVAMEEVVPMGLPAGGAQARGLVGADVAEDLPPLGRQQEG